MSYQKVKEWFRNPGWFRSKQEQDEEDPQRLILEDTQSLKKLFRKQGVLLEEVHREQKASAAGRKRDVGPLIDLCDALFYLQRAFQNPGLMSRQHAQVLNMVNQRMHRFAISFGIEMILAEGIPLDARIHEVVTNTTPDTHLLDVIEIIQPGYLQDGKVLRPAKVIVGKREDVSLVNPEGIRK